MNIVSGQKDPIIRLLSDLQTDDGRKKHSLFFVEGIEIVKRAFDFGSGVSCLILADYFTSSSASAELVKRAEAIKVPVYIASAGLIGKILGAKPIPESIAIVNRQVVGLSTIFAPGTTLVQMVESVENSDNLGMLLRTTDAAGLDGVILAANTVDPFSRRVARGSRGAVFSVPLCLTYSSASAISAARDAGFQVIATSANNSKPYTDIDYSSPTLLIAGNEHVGISDEVRENADAVVRIPMLGKINSLNIAVAASVVMYEALSQRQHH